MKKELTAWDRVEIARNPKRKTSIEYIENIFDDEYLNTLYSKVKGKKSPLDTYIAVYLLDNFSEINKENASNVEDYIDTILNGDFFKYDDKTSKQHQALIPFLAKCCDTLAVFYFDERKIENVMTDFERQYYKEHRQIYYVDASFKG